MRARRSLSHSSDDVKVCVEAGTERFVVGADVAGGVWV